MGTVYGGLANNAWKEYLKYAESNGTTSYSVTINCGEYISNSSYDMICTGDGVDAFGSIKTVLSATNQTSQTKTQNSANDLVSTTGLDNPSITKTYSWTKTHSSQSITIKSVGTITNCELWSGTNHPKVSGTSTAQVTLTIPAKSSYTVAYNANGGSGAPSSQTKWYGENLTLSSTVPTRSGWTFMGWGTSASTTTVSYAKGATYSANAAITLYAIWRKTITVTYNANGGSGAPSSQSVNIYNAASSGSITLSTTKPTRTGFVFLGWNTSSSATSADKSGGTAYSFSANTTLYAIWDAVPSIASLTAVRCDADETPNDEGECAKITCTWSLDGTLGDTATVTGTITPQTGGSATAFTLTTPATYGSNVVSTAVVGTVNGSTNGLVVDTDMQYTVSVTVANGSRSTYRNTIITRSFFIMDFKAGGIGLGIGRAAPANGLEIGFKTTFDDDITTYGNAFVKDHNVYLDNQDLDVSYNATLSAQKEGSTIIRGKNSEHLAAFRGRQLTTGEKRAIMESHGYDSNGNSIWCNLICQVNKNGTRSYSVSDQGAFRSAISGASTGANVFAGTQAIKGGTLNRDGSNPSSVVWDYSLTFQDKDGERYAGLLPARETDGRSRLGIYTWNEKTDGTEVNNSINLYIARDGTCTYAVSNAANFRSAIGALGKVPPSAELPHSTATSNVFPLVLGNTFANNGAISYQNPGEFRSTISAAAKTWTSIASTSGTTAKTFTNLSSSGYSEILIVCSYSTTYRGSVVLNIASISTTETEVYLTGGASGGGGRRACCKLTLTKLTPIQIGIDNVGYNANWTIHGR